MAKKSIVIIVLVSISCDGQLTDYFLPRLSKTARELSSEVFKDPVVNYATSAYGNALASTVDVITQVPLAIARGLASIEVPSLISRTNNDEYLDSIITAFNAASGNEDVNLNFEELVVKYGHKVQNYDIVTEDGYVLKMFRIPNNGPPVFLMHGQLGSADDFIISGPESGLAYLLASDGYDVWLGNARGNKHSRRHTHYDTANASFWDFSFHEIGVYDLPVMIDHVLKETGRESLKYIGHSQGTTSFFVMASERPEYNAKISLMIALSPVAFMMNVKSPVARALAPAANTLDRIAKTAGVYEFLPDSKIMRALKLIVCGTGPVAEILCSNSIFLIAGFDLAQLNVTNLPVLYGHSPAGSSIKQFSHFGQSIVSGEFRKFDYGISGNLEKYGQTTPPSYDLSKVVAPVALFYSEEDWLAQPADVMTLRNKLGNVIDFYKVPYQQFNHVDFVYALDFKTLIYERLRRLLMEF